MSMSLEQVAIASPCNVSWDSMQGEGAVRFCGQCQLNVYNLSEMPHDEAEALINTPGEGGERCVRFYRRKDGTVLTQNCPVGFARLRRRFTLLRAGVAAGLSFVLGGFMTGCEPTEAKTRGRPLPSAGTQPAPAVSPTEGASPIEAAPLSTPGTEPGEELEVLMGEMEACPTDEAPESDAEALESAEAQLEALVEPSHGVRMGRMIARPALPAPEELEAE
jgi:hypothetical protein